MGTPDSVATTTVIVQNGAREVVEMSRVSRRTKATEMACDVSKEGPSSSSNGFGKTKRVMDMKKRGEKESDQIGAENEDEIASGIEEQDSRRSQNGWTLWIQPRQPKQRRKKTFSAGKSV